LIGLMAHTTVAQMLARNDFATRYAEGTPIALHEFLYPIAQAYDSVAMRCDVELGGSDQLFNLLMGSEYQHVFEQPKQICMTLPILEGTDGVVRMGKSRGNYVGLTEPAPEQFGKLMSIPDEIMPRYALLAAFRPQAEVERFARELADGSLHPMDAKKALAQEIVARYHGNAAALAARERFESTFQRGEVPSDMPVLPIGESRTVSDVLVRAGFAASKREAKNLIAGGGVRIDGRSVDDPGTAWSAALPAVLSVGSRRFIRVLSNEG
jgi:tyrosyl-tRNA synthetase